MSQLGKENLQEIIAGAARREKTKTRWMLFAAHVVFATIFTGLAWIIALTHTGGESIGSGLILLTLLALFGCFFHLRSALNDSGMFQPSASDLLIQEIGQGKINLDSLTVVSTSEKPKRAEIRLGDDGELVPDDSTDAQPDRQHVQQSGQH